MPRRASVGVEARCSRRVEVGSEKGVETECGRGSVVISAGPELTWRGSDRLQVLGSISQSLPWPST